MKKITLFAAIFCAAFALQAQDDTKKNKTSIKITTPSGEFNEDEFANAVETAVEEMIKGISTSFSTSEEDGNLSFSMDFEGLGDMGDAIGRQVEEMVSNMEIEMENIDPEEFDDSQFNGRDGQEYLEEIEREYGSPVKVIEHMHLRLNKNEPSIKLKMRLEDGRLIEKTVQE